MIHRNADIVRHAAVYRYIGAYTRNLLAQRHCIQRNAGFAYDAAARLYADHGQRFAGRTVNLFQPCFGLFHVFYYGQRRIILCIHDAKAAAKIDLLHLHAQLGFNLHSKRREIASRRPIGLILQNLRTNMAVYTAKIQIGTGKDCANRFHGHTVINAKAEFTVLDTSLDIFMRMGLHARRYAHQYRHPLSLFCRDGLDIRNLFHAVNIDGTAMLYCHAQLRI